MKYSLLISIACIFLGRVEGILNGSSVALGEFPYMAAIIADDWVVCSGALISDRHVLTAAHCLTEDSGIVPIVANLTVELGMVNRTNTSTRITIEVERVGVHPDFVVTFAPLNVVNDIAVLTLKESVAVSELVKPIALPEQKKEYSQDTQYTFSGFGSATAWASPLDYLQKISTRVLSQDDCQAKWKNMTIKPGQMCAFAGSCQGDCGGPLTFGGEVVAVSSATGDDCNSEVPDIYTKVSHYIDFIKDEMYPTNKSLLFNETMSLIRETFEIEPAETSEKTLLQNETMSVTREPLVTDSVSM